MDEQPVFLGASFDEPVPSVVKKDEKEVAETGNVNITSNESENVANEQQPAFKNVSSDDPSNTHIANGEMAESEEPKNISNEFQPFIEEEKESVFKSAFSTGLTASIIKKAEVELGETETVKLEALKQIRDLIKEEPDFYPCNDDFFLVRFLRARKYVVSEAFDILKNYYKFKAENSGVISDLNPSDLKHVLELGNFITLEHRGPNDVAVILSRFGFYDITKFTLEEILANSIICSEVASQSEITQIVGFVIMLDCSNIDFNVLKHYARPACISKIISVFQDCRPSRVKAIHIINAPFYFNMMLKVVRLFLSDKMKERIHVHGNDLESLHRHIPPDILPEELGGKLGFLSEYAKKFTSRVLGYEDHFEKLKRYGYKGETLERFRQNLKS